jgi:hypothetical protein
MRVAYKTDPDNNAETMEIHFASETREMFIRVVGEEGSYA